MSPFIQILLIAFLVCLAAAIIVWLIAHYPLRYVKSQAFGFSVLVLFVFAAFSIMILSCYFEHSSKYKYKSMEYWDDKTLTHMIEYLDARKTDKDRALYILNYDAFNAYRKYDKYYFSLFKKHSEKYSVCFCVIENDNGYTYDITDEYK
jgi:hypothetical protein